MFGALTQRPPIAGRLLTGAHRRYMIAHSRRGRAKKLFAPPEGRSRPAAAAVRGASSAASHLSCSSSRPPCREVQAGDVVVSSAAESRSSVAGEIALLPKPDRRSGCRLRCSSPSPQRGKNMCSHSRARSNSSHAQARFRHAKLAYWARSLVGLEAAIRHKTWLSQASRCYSIGSSRTLLNFEYMNVSSDLPTGRVQLILP